MEEVGYTGRDLEVKYEDKIFKCHCLETFALGTLYIWMGGLGISDI